MRPVIFAVWTGLVSPRAAPAHVFRDESLQSASLGRLIKYRVLLPESYDATPRRRFPVLYLLHGLDGHYDDWSTRTHLGERLRSMPLIVVMPEGGDSWYTNAADGSGRFEDYIAVDLIHDVEVKFRAIRARYARAIAGLSMGGYGAIKIALKHPGVFQAAGSLSGAFDATDPAFARLFPTHTAEIEHIFGPPESDTRRQNDVFVMAGEAAPANAPAIFIDCGESDQFLGSNRRLADILQKRGFVYEYHETPGAHGWDYWDRRLMPLVEWVMGAFKAS
jgi:S-formylglutathione hydrolase FrmB